MRRQEQIMRQLQMAEAKRLEAEREERERRRQESEIQQVRDRHLKEKMQQISLTAHGQKILKKLDDEVSYFASYFSCTGSSALFFLL